MSGFIVFRPKERKVSVDIACLVVVLFTFIFKIIFVYFCACLHVYSYHGVLMKVR